MTNIVLMVIVGAFVGLNVSLGHALYANGGDIRFDSPTIWLEAAVVAVVTIVAALIALRLWTRREGRRLARPLGSNWLERQTPRRCRLVVFGAILLVWLPAFVCLFPGYYACDGPLQANALMNAGFVDLHWSAAHTLFLVGCLRGGNVLFGSFDAGLTLYCVVQGGLVAGSLAFCAERLVRWGVPVPLVCVVTFLVATNPVIEVFAFTTAADSLFSPFFLFSLVYFAEWIRVGEGFCQEKGRLARLGCCLLLVCLLRKQGIVVLGVTGLVALFTHGKKALMPVAVASAAIILSLVFGLIVKAVLPTQPDSPQEALSVPLQQIARVYALDRDSLSDEQVNRIGRYFDLEKLTLYQDFISDPTKRAFRVDAFERDRTGLFSLWIDLGKNHEGLYAESFLWGSVGYAYPSASVANDRSGLTPWNEFGIVLNEGGSANQITQGGYLSWYFGYLYSGVQRMFPKYPPLTIWVHMATPCYVLLASLLLLACRRRNPFLLIWCMPSLFLVILAFGPLVSIRYVVPLFLCVPLVVGLPFLEVEATEKRVVPAS